jgi:hypothetical protein
VPTSWLPLTTQTPGGKPDAHTERPLAALAGAGAMLATVWAVVAWLTGGFSTTVLGVRLAAREPGRALAAALLLLLVQTWVAGPSAVPGQLARLLRPFTSRRITIALPLVTIIAGLVWCSRIAGGADSYGYISQVDLWRHGHLTTPLPFAARVPWPDAVWTFTPLGYRPSPDGTGMVPLYSPGFPMLMAAARWIAGHCAMFWVVPLSGGLLVASTIGIGRRVGSTWSGIAAGWLAATSPIQLVMLMNPMSDLPAAALWAAATFAALHRGMGWAALAAACSAMAVLVRPNLVLLAAILFIFIAVRDLVRAPRRFGPAIVYAVAVTVAGLAIGRINQSLFGGATRSGYGDFEAMFTAPHVAVNLRHWTTWLWHTQSLAAFIGLAALFVPARLVWRSSQARWSAVLLAAIVTTVVGSYVAYITFEEWWSIRFLLPIWPAMSVGMAAVVAAARQRWRAPAVGVAAAALVMLIGLHGLGVAKAEGAFDTKRAEQKYAAVATLVRERVDPRGIVISGLHTGSLRYYGGRMTFRYDHLDPAWLDRAVAWFAERGIHPYLLLEEGERQVVIDRFAAENRLGRLDYAPLIVYKGAFTPVYLYDPLRLDIDAPEVRDAASVPVAFCPAPVEPPTFALD